MTLQDLILKGGGEGGVVLSFFSSKTEGLPLRNPGLEERVDVYRVATHITACVCLCLCAFGTMDQMTFFCFFFSQICIRVFYSSDILRACFC